MKYLWLVVSATMILGAFGGREEASSLEANRGATAKLPIDGQDDSSEIVGSWKFFKLILDGVERPPFNPNLILTFQFKVEGESILHWERTNEPGFCERKGRWAWDREFLEEEVVWVNPKNNRDCSMDPDMQMGRKTRSRAEINGGDLHLYFDVNGSSLIYVFGRQPLNSSGN